MFDVSYFSAFSVSLSFATTSGLLKDAISIVENSAVVKYGTGVSAAQHSGVVSYSDVICSGTAALCSLTARSRFTNEVTYSDMDLYGDLSPLHTCRTCWYISGETHPVSGFLVVLTEVIGLRLPLPSFTVMLFIVSLL